MRIILGLVIGIVLTFSAGYLMNWTVINNHQLELTNE